MDDELILKVRRATITRKLGGYRDDYTTRYANGEWPTSIFFDMVRNELQSLESCDTFLDVGCGRGVEGEANFQEELAEYCHRLVGVEPQSTVSTSCCFDQLYRCPFEEASIPNASVDLAWSFHVLEYVDQPVAFFDQLHRVLKPGAVFWAFTRDSRHYSTRVLPLNHSLQLHCNRPSDIARLTTKFSDVRCVKFQRAGESAWKFPRLTLPIVFAMDKLLEWAGAPGPFMAARLVR